jgi:hypothetical protein
VPQAGAETTFRGTLPTYVDPVVPAFLMTGDEGVACRSRSSNTTDDAVTGTLRLEVNGATLARPPRPVRVAGQGSVVAYAGLRAGRPGTVTLQVGLGGKDAIERSFPVRPSGRPVTESRNGTLAAPRTLELALPDDADPESASARLQVFPGALAVLRSELGAAVGREEAGSDAYALLLAGRGEQLLRSLGGEPEPAALRTLGILAAQRAVRAVRAPEVTVAASSPSRPWPTPATPCSSGWASAWPPPWPAPSGPTGPSPAATGGSCSGSWSPPPTACGRCARPRERRRRGSGPPG